MTERIQLLPYSSLVSPPTPTPHTPSPASIAVIGGGHAGAEAAWAAANLIESSPAQGLVYLITQDPARVGVMSCNPAIGGLAKGQLVREIDALGGLMGLATDATGIQFKVLNASKGPAVHGPRAQCDKHAYAREVQRLLATRPSIRVIAGEAEDFIVEGGRCVGVRVKTATDTFDLRTAAVVLTTGTFMRGLMHTGEQKSAGGRFGEAPAVGVSAALARLGFELGRLKTGTPPRLRKGSIRWQDLPEALGDGTPVPFSDLTLAADALELNDDTRRVSPTLAAFPILPQVECRQTTTTAAAHDLIRANLHRAPMFSGQIESVGPRYCPSIEDKVVRFADRDTHGVFLEPESLDDDWIYCNGVSTSLPADVQDQIIRTMPGCENAEILRYGYAVEYDMVRPHQILATGMTRALPGLFLAGQINGTSGYEEAAAQGLVAGVNAARLALGHADHESGGGWILGRDQAYIGVLMDDLVTKTPVEPYRMFTSRAEHRLLLRADNTGERLTPVAEKLGLLNTPLGRLRLARLAARATTKADADRLIDRTRTVSNVPMDKVIRQADYTETDLAVWLAATDAALAERVSKLRLAATIYADRKYAPYVERALAEIRRGEEMEHRTIPHDLDDRSLASMRTEARHALIRFRPRTFGQASRLEGLTPADLTLLAVLVKRHRDGKPLPPQEDNA